MYRLGAVGDAPSEQIRVSHWTKQTGFSKIEQMERFDWLSGLWNWDDTKRFGTNAVR